MAHAADNIELSAPGRPAARDSVEAERPETAAKGRIELQGVVKSYDAVTAVDRVDLTVAAGSYCCLLGPSGCGKTSTLRMVAGHEEISAGRILIDGHDGGGPTPAERPTAMMFQNYALFPHLKSIEGYYDEVFSVPAMLDAVKAHPDAAGVVVGCFDDTGVDAARCVISAPVIGICQAAMQVASIVSGSFTVVTTLSRSVPALEHLARRYGYADLCRKVRASEIPVLALEDPASGARDQLRSEVRRALEEDGCEAVVQ